MCFMNYKHINMCIIFYDEKTLYSEFSNVCFIAISQYFTIYLELKIFYDFRISKNYPNSKA